MNYLSRVLNMFVQKLEKVNTNIDRKLPDNDRGLYMSKQDFIGAGIAYSVKIN